MFRHVTRIFEPPSVGTVAAVEDPLVASIRTAWKSDDVWLHACAVRASRHAKDFDRSLFATEGGDHPLVRAELDSLTRGGVLQGVPC